MFAGLRRMVGLAVALIMLIAIGSAALAADQFGWMQFTGQELRCLMATKSWHEFVKPYVPQFEKQTGVKVKWEAYAETPLRQKLAIELAAGAGNLDAFAVDPVVNGRRFWTNGWVCSLNDFLDDPTLTSPTYDYADISPAAMKSETFQGEVSGIPDELDGQILWYRKDLFVQAALTVPQTLQEMESAAKKLTIDENDDGRIEVYGMVMRGLGQLAVSQWSTYFLNFGGWWLDSEGNAAINTPEAIEAFDYYGRLLRRYGPPGVTNYNHWDAMDTFAAGRAAMYTDAASFRPKFTDPEQSEVMGKWGAAPVPAGPAGRHPMMNTWGLNIAKKSEHKEASWFFIQWFTRKELMAEALMHGIPVPRTSAWTNPDFTAQDPYPDWTEAVLGLFETGNPQFQAPVINVEKAKDIVGQVITMSITGQDVEKAANEANASLQKLIESERRKYGL